MALVNQAECESFKRCNDVLPVDSVYPVLNKYLAQL